MKFISGIKQAKFKKSGELKINIPFYHRVCMGLVSRTKVYYIYRNYTENTINKQVRELILTTNSPKRWHRIRKIAINTIDKPGIIRDITDELKNRHINVHIVEDIATEIDSNHSITLIVDLWKYNNDNNIDPKDEINVDNTIKGIIGDVIKKISPSIDNNNGSSSDYNINDYHALYKKIKEPKDPIVTKLTFPYTNSSIFDDDITHIDGDQFRQNDYEHQMEIDEGSFTINETLQTHLELNEPKKLYYTMFSDTEEKYIKMLFFDPKQFVVFIDIFHEDVPGAYFEITKLISKYGNVLASYSRQIMGAKTAHWYALIDISNATLFYSETLKKLKKNCTYGEHNDKRVKKVFLIESNKVAEVPPGVIKEFGFNSRTEENKYTEIFFKKVELLTDEIINYIITKKIQSIDDLTRSRKEEYITSLVGEGDDKFDDTKSPGREFTTDLEFIDDILFRINELSKSDKKINGYIDKNKKYHQVDKLDEYLLDNVIPKIPINILKKRKKIIYIIRLCAIVLLWLAIFFISDFRNWIFDFVKGAFKTTMDGTIAYIVGSSLLVIFGDKIVEIIKDNIRLKITRK